MLMRLLSIRDMLGFVDAVPSDALQPEDRRGNSLRIVKTHFGVVQNVPKDLRRCPSPDSGDREGISRALSGSDTPGPGSLIVPGYGPGIAGCARLVSLPEGDGTSPRAFT